LATTKICYLSTSAEESEWRR